MKSNVKDEVAAQDNRPEPPPPTTSNSGAVAAGTDPAIVAAASGTVDDIEALICIPAGEAEPSARKVLVQIPVRKPGRSEFFRVHPDTEYQRPVYIYENRETFGETYVVVPGLASALGGVVSRRLLQLSITRQGAVFLWPIKIPDANGRQNAWIEQAIEVAKRARSEWVRMAPNMAAGGYDVFVVEAGVTVPEPEWPPLSMADVLRLAFGKDKVVSSADHPIVRQLLGKV